MNLNQLKKILLQSIVALLVPVVPTAVLAAGGGPAPEPVENTMNDLSTLQNGAKIFVNYCLNCHGASSLRYSKLQEIGLTKELIEKNLLFTGEKVSDMMTIAMDRNDAKKWLGTVPPDLSLIARSRSPDWLYSYLRNFYVDNNRELGWNNRYFENVGMPNPLWELQGLTEPIKVEQVDPHDSKKTHEVITGVKVISAGKQTPEQFEQTVSDLVNFLRWMGEPYYHKRVSVGAWVLIFLFILAACTWALNKAYWKDIK